MNVKLILTYLWIILDVMIFPFSCVGNNQNKNEYFFVINIQDEIHEEFYFDEYRAKIPKPAVIGFPDQWEYELPEQYEITKWCILGANHEKVEDRDIVFPYHVLQEDYLSYYRGHRNCIVFEAVWEYVGNV